jgi:hypothetical protein
LRYYADLTEIAFYNFYNDICIIME